MSKNANLTRNERAFAGTLIMTLLLLLTIQVSAAESPFSSLNKEQQRSEDILREAVGFESTIERPEETRKALQAMADRLIAAGFDPEDVELIESGKDEFGLIARYRGTGTKKPILVLAHMDVVTATPDSWAFPPFSLGKKDGFYLGRGTTDNKTGVTQIISNFVRLKEEGWLPNRDIIAALSGDEETDGQVAKWQANEGSHLTAAEYAINSDAGGGELDQTRTPKAFYIQTSEKVYQTYVLTARNPGGHSSRPRPDNAIQDLAVAITRLTQHQFPVILNNTTRMELRRSAAFYTGDVARDMKALAEDDTNLEAAERLSVADPGFMAMLHTTCVPTMLSGGHAENALPRDASVTVNCRIMPGTPAIEIENTISSLIKDLNIDIEVIYDGIPSQPSELPDAFLESIETMVEERWPGIPVIPSMSAGATDGLFYRNAGMPVYGISGCFGIPGEGGAHGLDEKIGIAEFHECVAFWYDMLKNLTR